MKSAYLDKLQKVRDLAVEMFAQGRANAEIARDIGACRQTVSRWRTVWSEKGPQGLKVRPYGKPHRMTQDQWLQVEQALLKGPRERGYDTEFWTLARIADLIEKETGISYHTGHIWKILTRFGWSCQKPERRAKERDEEEIERWKVESWPLIKRGRKRKAPGWSL